jgi:hypothetical protein
MTVDTLNIKCGVHCYAAVTTVMPTEAVLCDVCKRDVCAATTGEGAPCDECSGARDAIRAQPAATAGQCAAPPAGRRRCH